MVVGKGEEGQGSKQKGEQRIKRRCRSRNDSKGRNRKAGRKGN